MKRFIHNFRQVYQIFQQDINCYKNDVTKVGLGWIHIGNPLSMSNLWLKLKFVDMKRKSIDSKPDLKNQKTRNPTRGVTN